MKVVALAGGVGGAKLAEGLNRLLLTDELTIIVNTGDDFKHFGLHISPDLDTVCYTLAGLANKETGWGRANETWQAMECITELGGPDWFHLGDRDLGLHLERTRRLQDGQTLSQVTRQVCQALRIRPHVLPMSDDFVPTFVCTEEGELPFQEYFVQRSCQPMVTGFRFQNMEKAQPAPGVIEALVDSDLVIVCPSNPWVSIGPILAVPGIRGALASCRVMAISPIVGGKAVKGPAAKMYLELGIQPSAVSVARHYGDLLSGFILDQVDCELTITIQNMGVQVHVTDTIMASPAERFRLACEVVEFGLCLIQSEASG